VPVVPVVVVVVVVVTAGMAAMAVGGGAGAGGARMAAAVAVGGSLRVGLTARPGADATRSVCSSVVGVIGCTSKFWEGWCMCHLYRRSVLFQKQTKNQEQPRRVFRFTFIFTFTIALHCIALHCIALHCIASHCIALHCIQNGIALH
jgi:hypothetical protein